MKIGIDIRATQSHHKYRGIGKYTRSLVEGMALIDKKNEYVLFGEPGSKNDMKLNGMNFTNVDVVVNKSMGGKIARLLFGQKIATDQYQLDVFLQPDVFAGRPTDSAYKIAVFYDLIPLIFKREYFDGLKGYRARLSYFRYKKGIGHYKKFDTIITISDSSKRDLIRETGIDSAKINVIYPGFDHGASRPTKSALVSAGDRYLLYVGSCDYRKNISTIVDAFDSLKEKSLIDKLILVGKDFAEPGNSSVEQTIAQSRFSDHISTPGFLSEGELAWLYQNAIAYIYPSLYEGFGLPVVEAMGYSCPVLTFDNSSLHEVGGDAAIYAQTAQEMVEAVDKLESDRNYRDHVVARSLTQSKKFSWQQTSKKVLELLERRS